MPFALTVVRNTGGGNQDLWYTIWDAEKGEWSEQSEFNDNLSRSRPALAQHGDKLYCVHCGQGSEGIYWSTNESLGDYLSNHGPALAVFKDKVYMVHHSDKNA